MFDGVTFDEARDGARLGSLLEKVRTLMLDGEWRTLSVIAEACDADSEASISARLRDLRKPKFGGYKVERQYVRDGLWQYRILPPQQPVAPVVPEQQEVEPASLFDVPSRRGSFYDVD